MKPFEFIQHWESRGVSFQLNGDRVLVNAPGHVATPELQAEMKRCKPFLLDWLKRRAASADWRERFHERAALRHHDGDLPLHEAEYLASRELLHEYLASCHPAVLAEFDAMITQPVRH